MKEKTTEKRKTMYLPKINTNFTDGNGPLVSVAVCENKETAKQLAAILPGVMSNFNGERGDSYVKEVPCITKEDEIEIDKLYKEAKQNSFKDNGELSKKVNKLLSRLKINTIYW